MTDVPTRPAASDPKVFSTSGLPTARRLELWESHNEHALIGLRCRTLTSEALEATEVNVQVDRLHLARVRGSAHVVERDATLVRRRPTESIALFFTLVGEAFYYHQDGVHALRPGQLLVCDADRPFVRGFSGGLEELVVKIPRTVFADVTGTDRVEQPRVVTFAGAADPVAHALARTVGRAARDHDATPVEEHRLLQLVGLLTGDREHDPATAHGAAARAFVERHLADPALSAEVVAAGIGLSTRHLSRVFAASGTSLPRYVLGRRLERARTLLSDPALAALQVSEVARRCGFTSATHFSAAFSERFGETASQVRRRTAAAARATG